MDSRRYAAVTKEFYSRLTGEEVRTIEDIPREALEFMAGLEYTELVRPIILNGLRQGVPIRTLSSVYGVSRVMVRNIRRRFKLDEGTQRYPDTEEKK